jgi:SAM-dependent methyltransferase
MATIATSDPALEAYECLAPFYDRFTAGYEYEDWLAAIEARARELGLSGRRLLDIGCGTGKSFAPLLARGYRVSACDISPAMVRETRTKFPRQLDRVFVADMRELPPVGEFDLVTCLDDAINYLLSEDELVATFEGVARVLSPGGIYVFDANSLKTYRSAFAQALVREDATGLFCWRGETHEDAEAGDVASATVEVFVDAGAGLWHRFSSRHVQRHHPPHVVIAALEEAGLECLDVAGQLPGGRLEPTADEDVHIKLVYMARKAAAQQGQERGWETVDIIST